MDPSLLAGPSSSSNATASSSRTPYDPSSLPSHSNRPLHTPSFSNHPASYNPDYTSTADQAVSRSHPHGHPNTYTKTKLPTSRISHHAAHPSSTKQIPPTIPVSAPNPPIPLVEPHQTLDEFLESFWGRQMDSVENEELGTTGSGGGGGGIGNGYSHVNGSAQGSMNGNASGSGVASGSVSGSGSGAYSLPLARIKKVMKSSR
jgi:hypothetical protein